jgi:quercetin dioxygenase-like cupin family protein
MGCGVVTEFIQKHPLSVENVLEDFSTNYEGVGLKVKQVLIPAGHQVVQHKHPYPHLSILQYGRVQVMTDEWTKELVGPDCLVIEAHVHHMVIAHTDAMWLCIHAS